MAKWFEDFLSCRRQRVTIGEASSKWTDVLSGVPQGSVLGPLLFFIYINDLPDKIVNLMKLFADDSKIISSIKGEMDINKLQNDLLAVGDWCRTWGMRLNVEKCKVIYFGKSNPKEVYCMLDSAGNENDIEATNLERDLGVIVGSDLKWREHVDRMVGKANWRLDMLKRTFESRDPGLWKDLYVSLVRPYLEYVV